MLKYCIAYFNSLNSRYNIETSQLICKANRLTGFYMMVTLASNELTHEYQDSYHYHYLKQMKPMRYCQNLDLQHFHNSLLLKSTFLFTF